MPLPIPEKPWSDEFSYFLVAVPSDRGFIRAVKGHFGELGREWLWGEEGLESDSADAAQRMLEAIDETWRLIEMGWPDDVLGHIDEVETLLRLITRNGGDAFCCPDLPGADSLIADVEGALETSPTDVSGGVFPDGMTGGEFDAYLCAAATAYVDKLIDLPNDVLDVFQGALAGLITLVIVYTTGAYIGIAGAILGVFTLPVILELISTIESVIADVQSGTEPQPSVPSGELSAARDDLICAIYQANDAASAAVALRNAIGEAVTSIAWENLLLLWPHETLLAKVFNGDADGAPGAVCECAEVTPAGYHFETPIGQPALSWHTNTTNRSWTYDEATGLLTVDFDSQGGDQATWTADWGINLYTDGYELELEEFTGPSDFRFLWPEIATLQYDQDFQVGQIARGYHTGNHSGTEWDDWAAIADHVRNYSFNKTGVAVEESPDKSVVANSSYHVVLRVRILRPD